MLHQSQSHLSNQVLSEVTLTPTEENLRVYQQPASLLELPQHLRSLQQRRMPIDLNVLRPHWKCPKKLHRLAIEKIPRQRKRKPVRQYFKEIY